MKNISQFLMLLKPNLCDVAETMCFQEISIFQCFGVG